MVTSSDQKLSALPEAEGTGQFFRGAVLLMSATALSAVLGFGFWTVAARVLPAAEVGRDGAVVTALIALSSACQLNLAAALPRFLPELRGGAARAVRLSYAASAGVAALCATGFVFIAPSLAGELRVLHAKPVLSALFVVGVMAWSIMAVQDAALAAVRRAGWLPVEQVINTGLRITVLSVAAIVGTGHAIILAWVLPLAAVVPVGAWILFARGLPAHANRPREGAVAATGLHRGRRGRFLAIDWVAYLLRQIALGAMPVAVLSIVGSKQAAAFNVPFALVIAFDLLFVGAATSFTIEGAQHGARLAELVRALVRRFLVPMLAASVVLAVAAPLVLLPFGGDYSEDGAAALRLLALGSGVRAVLVLIEVLQRLRGDVRPVLGFSVVGLVALAALTPPLVHAHGVAGAGAAWLAANAAAAVAVAPIGWRTLRQAWRA